ncbi:MAG: hypothetical protein F6K44_06515 [Moorea sp. SIO3E2]|nr:hypothetical protein [Moorena sp. SIO3E2]NER86196.1 hypothetical protein [Moorena sp. SIO3A2]NES41365.1 hypothetical protein [Moorena sp. SIO2C4]
MNGLFDILEKIEKCPGMYIDRSSVTDLFMFLVGYEYARSEMDIDLTEAEAKFYDEFQPWLQEKLGVNSVTSWAKLIMLSCHDEKVGFESFFRLLAEFKQNHGLLATESSHGLVRQ